MPPPRTRKHPKQPSTVSELASAAALDAAADFTAPSLAGVDHALRCPICAELFTAPVILTACSHSFDSRCLRHYLATHKRCPACFLETTEDRIRVNLALQTTVQAWKDARADLLRLQAAASRSPAPQAGSSSPTPASAPRPPEPFVPATRTPSATVKGKRKASALAASSTVKPEPREAVFVDDDGSSDVEIIEEARESSSAVKRPPKKKLKSADGAAKGSSKGMGRLEAADPTDPSLILECPLCGGSIRNALMALHVERCTGVPPTGNSSAAWGKLLGGGTGKSGENESSAPSMRDKKLDTTRHLPLASYAHKSVAELAEMLKEYNLPTTLPASPLTTEAKLTVLTRRHRHFLVLWNANADVAADDPAHQTAQGVRDELARWERTQDAPTPVGDDAGGKAHLNKYAADFRAHVARARASARAAKERLQPQQEAQEQPRPSTPPPPPAPATGKVSAKAASATAPATEPPLAARKRSVRVVSPPRSSPPLPPLGGTRSPPAASSAGSSSPPLPAHRTHSSPAPAAGRGSGSEYDEERSVRSESPFDGERPPRASQRNREEERMFAEMAAREEARELLGEGSGGVGASSGSEDQD
ncbi:hypothetical protein JCM3770_003847 [Rhodotorula araucariae]